MEPMLDLWPKALSDDESGSSEDREVSRGAESGLLGAVRDLSNIERAVARAGIKMSGVQLLNDREAIVARERGEQLYQ